MDWNVVITVSDAAGYRAVRRKLRHLGQIDRTDFHNVMVMRVCDVAGFLQALEEIIAEDRGLLDNASRIVPAHSVFDFSTAAQFDEQSRTVVAAWSPRLAGSSFHVRIHRRGHKSELSSQREESILDRVVIVRTGELARPARMDFADPDFIINVETVGGRAGLSLWTRGDRARYPFLRLD
jgi:tRNA(Ser,Leu) C12 N-acetylase TAN1